MARVVLITSFVLAILAKLSISSIPGLPHYSLQQQSILSDLPLLKHATHKQIIYVPVPVCGACEHKCPQINVHHKLNYHQQISGSSINRHSEVGSGYAGQYTNQHGSDFDSNSQNIYHHSELGLSTVNHQHGGKITVSFKQNNHHHHGGGVSEQSISQVHNYGGKHSEEIGLSEEELHKKHKNAHYRFAYSVNDHKTGDVKRHEEERKGDVVNGEYSLVEDDGNVRTVKYYADWKTGFHAQVHNTKPRP